MLVADLEVCMCVFPSAKKVYPCVGAVCEQREEAAMIAVFLQPSALCFALM